MIIITFAAGLVPPTREDAIWQWVSGAIFVLIFAVLIYWRGWWLLSAFLIFSNVWRMTNYFNAGLGLHIELRAHSITPVAAKPLAFLNAALMAVIVFMLVRSAWTGLSDWRARRVTERGS